MHLLFARVDMLAKLGPEVPGLFAEKVHAM